MKFATRLQNRIRFKTIATKETIKRYQFINDVLKVGLNIDTTIAKDYRSKLDRVLTHKVWGYVIFSDIIYHFQSIFEWSKIPMDFIDASLPH
jgi:ferrous iron transport protein B